MDIADQTLQHLRARIDATDESIAQLLIARIGIIREVAALKAKNWPKSCHIRPGREGQMHRAITQRFAETGFPPLMALAIWRQLIGGSTHVESPLRIAYLSTYPEHYFLGREYFGLQIQATQTADVAEAIQSLQKNQNNILLLPTPQPQASLHHAWWRDARALRDAGFFIFASLPVVQESLPASCTTAIALAAVTPEDSGDDVSYFLKHDQLHLVDGFVTELPDALFLGAHPRPIRLSSGVMYA